VVAFFAFHVYWYLGGSFGQAGSLPDTPHSSGGWVFEVLVVSAFPLGAWACLTVARERASGGGRRAAAILVWLACALLIARGGSGVIDELTRVTGLLPDGITGLSLKDTMGTARPSASALWSSRAIDGYFLAGGIVFGLLGYRSTRSKRGNGEQRAADDAADNPIAEAREEQT
jgi:hypothetical protein